MMATAAANDAVSPLAAEGLMLQDILSGDNLAELLDDNERTTIGQWVIRDVDIDEASRGDWKDRYQRWLDVAMQVKKPKNFPWPDAANTKHPLLTIAAMQFWVRAVAVFIDGSNMVKGKVLGPDPDGEKRARADRIAQHMTWQLLYRMLDWEEDTDRLLFMLPIVGLLYRKTYYDNIGNVNRSEMITGVDCIVNYWAKSLETTPRITQVLRYYPYEVREFVNAGLWLEIPLDDTAENADGNDDQALGEYYEQHRCLDLDKDGYPEHYVVTCTKEGRVARVAPCFGPENITVGTFDLRGKPGPTMKLVKVAGFAQQDPSVWQYVGEIVRIERRQYFTKYGFIPAPDASFYDLGFGSLLEGTCDEIDTLKNQMIDAASLANAGGGFLGSGVNVRSGNFKFALGEWKRVDAGGGLLKDNILPFNAPGPSAVSFQLLELMISLAKDITATSDISLGELPVNAPATSALAALEQSEKVMGGILKRTHRSFGQELRKLRRLNRDFLDEEEYFQLNDEAAVRVGREDYADDDLDVMPVSDPRQVSDMQKMLRAQARFQMFNGDPLINQIKLRRDVLESIGTPDIKTYFEVPKPQPPPELLLGMAKEERGKALDDAKAEQARASAALDYAAGAKDLAESGLVDDAAILAAKAVGEDDGASDQSGRGAAMAGPPGDAGPAPAPPGAPAGMGGPMEPGGMPDPSGAGASDGGSLPGGPGFE